MILKVRNNMVFKEDGTCVAVLADLPPDELEEVERAIEYGSEAAPAIDNFLNQVNSGKFKPRATVKELEKIADKYK